MWSKQDKDLNIYVLNIIIGKNLSKILAKDISCQCKCRFDEKQNVIQINGGITTNVNVSVKDAMYVKKIIFGILLHVIVKIGNI